MTEEKVRKRGWIKNVAIIFLAAMLVLTLFSNQIMNRSLPEVAYKYVESGSITARIRGTGTVEAVESYEVKIGQTREVESVHVKVGAEVQPGDILFSLADTESSELESARQALEELNLSYQKALINATDSDYAKEDRDIKLAREKLAEAEAERDESLVSASQIANAKAAVEAAKTAVKAAEENVASCEAKVTKAQNDLTNNGGSSEGYTETEIQQKQNEVNVAQDDLRKAETELDVARLAYANDYADLKAAATTAAGGAGATEEEIKLHMAALSEQYKDAEAGDPGYGWNKAYTAISTAESKVATLTTKLQGLQAELSSMKNHGTLDSSEYYRDRLETAQNNLQKAKDKLKEAQDTQAKLEEKLKELEEKETTYDEAVEAVKTAQVALEDLLFALEEQQKTDGKTQELEELDLQKMRSDIARQQRQLNKLQTETTDSTVISKVSGIVTALNITAGNSTTPDEILAVIEVVDRGYTVSFSVTTEQSRRVTVGDSAEVTGGYHWGSSINASLATIKNDPQNPGTSKLLVFSVSGDVEAGSTLNISIGERSANYEAIVPNSAVRSDTNGDFVLVLGVKSSPLGNRYVATRVDVNVLAKDDTNTAVSGGLLNSDMVITTSTKPIEAGMYVKLPDNG